MIKQQILDDLKEVIKDLGYPTTDVVLSISPFGDYSTNIALQLAKHHTKDIKQFAVPSAKRDKRASEIASVIVKRLKDRNYLEKIEVAEPGFINFYIKKEIFSSSLKEVLSMGGNFGKSNLGKGKKARVEFISSNPTGPMHIGNGRGGPIGDVLASVLEFMGYQVLREYYHNDVGNQVKTLGVSIKAIAEGKSLSDEHYKGEYVAELASVLKDKIKGISDEEIGHLAVEFNFDSIMEDIRLLSINFDQVYKESDMRKEAAEVVDRLKKAGVVREKDGALWLAPSDEFLEDRETVIVKSNGSYTYLTADIVYHSLKFESGADLIIDIFGADHFGHVPRLQASMKALGYDIAKLKFLIYQYVRVKRGGQVVKLSKRAGNLITVREILDEVGRDAFRFTMLSYTPNTHIDFDLDLLKQKSKNNPVYFVQYAYVRMSAILQKVHQTISDDNLAILDQPTQLALIKQILEFPDVLLEVVHTLQPSKLTNYALVLAEKCHRFYETCPVLSASDDIKNARLVLVRVCQIVLANALSLLRISAPEKM